MIEILPLNVLTNEDALIFGSVNVNLGKLSRVGFPVAKGVVVTAPSLKLQTTLEHFDFKTKESFEQTLTLVKKEIFKVPVPEILDKETKSVKKFLFDGKVIDSKKELWVSLLQLWIEEIKKRLWKDGFYKGVSENLTPKTVIFINKKIDALGYGFFDNLQDDSVIKTTFGKLHPNDIKKIDEIIKLGNKKLFLPYEYEWILDRGIKLIGIKPYTPNPAVVESINLKAATLPVAQENKIKSTIKVFYDLSTGFTIEKNVDGIFIATEKIFDLNKVQDSYENMLFKLVEAASTFPNSPILFKLADKSEGMGRLRGTLRLLHQQNLLNPMVEALDFARHKKNLTNVHIVVPYIRNISEFLKIKRELAIKKLMRKNSLQLWLELAVPENIVNLEEYLVAGLDGVVLNLDELISSLNGFDPKDEELSFYKNEAKALMKFLEDGLKLLHKSKIPFITYGSLSLYPDVLDFLIEKGVHGIIVERYEASSAHELLHQTEKRLVLRRSS